MRFLVFLLSFSLVFSAMFEVEGNLESTYIGIKGSSPKDTVLLKGKLGGGFGGGNACGISAGANFYYGVKTALDGLMEFIDDWKSSATAVALYALATYLPVAKEALLGANTLSNFLASLRGFSCSQAMEILKELNYTDSFLVKKCIARRLGIREEDVDALKDLSPQSWYSAYRACLNSTSLVDLLGWDGAKNFLKLVSPRSYVKCTLGISEEPTLDDLRSADLSTRAKYLLYLLTPDLTLSGDGSIKIRTVQIKDEDGIRPISVGDVYKLFTEDFEEEYALLLEELKSADLSSDFAEIEDRLESFGQKYGLNLERVKYLLGVSVTLLRELEKLNAQGLLSFEESDKHLQALSLLRKEIKDLLLAEAVRALSLALQEHAHRVVESVRTMRTVGTQNSPCGG